MAFNPMNAREYIENCLFIRDKKTRTIPFKLNKPQLRLYEAMAMQRRAGLPVRLIVLKARQMGFSTLTGGVMFSREGTAKNRLGLIVSHKDEQTKELFGMHKRFLDNLPPQMRPQVAASNGYEIVFDRPTRSKSKVEGLGSRIKCATAGGKGLGRGSTIQDLHLSELAFWPGDPRQNLLALMQAVPDDPGTMVVIESTANGYNTFKDLWDEAEERKKQGNLDGFWPVFFPWHELAEYRRTVPPGFRRTDGEEELARLYGLDDEQLYWRRWCIETNCAGDARLFKQEYPACPEEAFLATGTCVFDQERLVARIEELRKAKAVPIKTGDFGITYGGSILDIKKWEWRDDPKGCIRIYREPEPGVPYVIGADTAGSDGKDKDSDFFAAHVLDNRTGAQVAVLHGRLGEREFTEQLFALGKTYNNALIGIETNYSTYPNELIQLMGYRRLYVQQHTDDFTKKVITKYGWDTNRVTRPLIIDGLKDVAKHSMELIGDIPTLQEMLVFIKNASGRPEAEVGQHDDLVMSLAIAHYIRGQQRVRGSEEAGKAGNGWTDELLEDYREATPRERREMVARYGPLPARRKT